MTPAETAAPPPPPTSADEWAIVEMMGHRQRAGRISEVTRFGASMMRLDVPAGDGFVTKFIGGATLYEVTTCTEEVARAAAARMADPRPIAPAAFRERPALAHHQEETEGGDDRPL